MHRHGDRTFDAHEDDRHRPRRRDHPRRDARGVPAPPHPARSRVPDGAPGGAPVGSTPSTRSRCATSTPGSTTPRVLGPAPECARHRDSPRPPPTTAPRHLEILRRSTLLKRFPKALGGRRGRRPHRVRPSERNDRRSRERHLRADRRLTRTRESRREDGASMEPSRRNQRQPTANRPTAETAETSQIFMDRRESTVRVRHVTATALRLGVLTRLPPFLPDRVLAGADRAEGRLAQGERDRTPAQHLPTRTR